LEPLGWPMAIGGVLDPAAKIQKRTLGPEPETVGAAIVAQSGNKPLFKLLLAHNPKLAARAEAAGFDLQLSGHTHAGQFFPWTLVTWLVHKPHYAGLSREGRLQVYVNAG